MTSCEAYLRRRSPTGTGAGQEHVDVSNCPAGAVYRAASSTSTRACRIMLYVHNTLLWKRCSGLDDSQVQKVKTRAEALRPSRGDTELVTAAEAVASSLPEEEEEPVAKKWRWPLSERI